jgi:hypothetical protein
LPILPVGIVLFETLRAEAANSFADTVLSLALKLSETPVEAMTDFLRKLRRLKVSDIIHLSILIILNCIYTNKRIEDNAPLLPVVIFIF